MNLMIVLVLQKVIVEIRTKELIKTERVDWMIKTIEDNKKDRKNLSF